MAKRMARAKPRQGRSKPSLRSRVKNISTVLRSSGIMTVGLIALVSVFYAGYKAMDMPLENVQLNARFERVNTLDVEKVLANYKQEKFLSIQLDQLQQELESIDWVDRVEVRRRWPAGLMVTLSEHVAAARWGKSGLLNTRGELILKDARHLPPELPELDGPQGSEWQVAQQYLELHKNVLRYGLNIEYLAMDTRGAWRFKLSNGTQVRIGREATDERFYRFSHRVLPLLFQLPKTASVIDMRYSNGFAVKWQPSIEIKDELENKQSSNLFSGSMYNLNTDSSGETTYV